MSGSRSSTPWISVPLPAPDGPGDDEEDRDGRRPVRYRRSSATSSARWRSDSPPTVFDCEIRQVVSNRAGLHAAALRHGQQQIEHLGGQHPLRRVARGAPRCDAVARLQVALQLRAGNPNDVRALQRLHALVEAPCWGLGGELLRGRHGTRIMADLGPRRKAEPPVFLRETATSADVNGHVFQITCEGMDKAHFGTVTMPAESGETDGRVRAWATSGPLIRVPGSVCRAVTTLHRHARLR